MNNKHICEEIKLINGIEIDIFWDKIWILEISDRWDARAVEVNYCPFCGKKLEEDGEKE